MTPTRLFQAAALSAALVAASAAAAYAQAQQRDIYVSALDQSGAPVESLAPTDVIVREDKVAREVLSVIPAQEPLHIALLVDNSQASETYIRDYREALPAFISTIFADESGASHQISLITLAERPTINSDYTSDASRLTTAASRIFAIPGSGTYLLDGIYEISEGLKKHNFTRPVIVAVTTEGPEMSNRQYQTVLAPLRAAGAAFHVIIVGNPRNTSYDRSMVLDQGTREGGGRFDTLLTGNALTARMKQVATELTHQFRVTYSRPQTLIPPEQVTVASGKEGLTVRGVAALDPPSQERR